MKLQLKSVSVAAVLVMTALASSAWAAPFNLRWNGATSATEIDINDDGIPGVLALGQGRGSIGNVTTHTVFDAAPVPTANCSAGEIENVFVAATSVIQDRSGDQLFLALQSGYLCANATFTGASVTVTEQVVGGTGKFAGATGQLNTNCSLVFLALDLIPAGGRPAHAAFSCKTTGNLN